jgi:hypothetical protein
VRPPDVTIHVLDGGVGCVYVDPASFDRSCETDADCVRIAVGTLCSDQPCVVACGNTHVNAAGLPRYEQAVASFPPVACPCPEDLGATCVQGRCGP